MIVAWGFSSDGGVFQSSQTGSYVPIWTFHIIFDQKILSQHMISSWCLLCVTGAGRGCGGRLHLPQETAPDHDALLLLTEHTTVQEENSSAGATTGIHAGPGTHTYTHLLYMRGFSVKPVVLKHSRPEQGLRSTLEFYPWLRSELLQVSLDPRKTQK